MTDTWLRLYRIEKDGPVVIKKRKRNYGSMLLGQRQTAGKRFLIFLPQTLELLDFFTDQLFQLPTETADGTHIDQKESPREVSIAKDQSKIAVTFHGNLVAEWSLHLDSEPCATLLSLHTFQERSGAIRVSYSSDSSRIVVFGWIFETETIQVVHSLNLNHTFQTIVSDAVTDFAFHPLTNVPTISGIRIAEEVAYKSEKPMMYLQANSFCFSVDGQFLVIAKNKNLTIVIPTEKGNFEGAHISVRSWNFETRIAECRMTANNDKVVILSHLGEILFQPVLAEETDWISIIPLLNHFPPYALLKIFDFGHAIEYKTSYRAQNEFLHNKKIKTIQKMQSRALKATNVDSADAD